MVIMPILMTYLFGCMAPVSQSLIIDDVLFSIVNVEFPYKLPREECYLGKSPYNQELDLSEMGIVLPFGVVCGCGDGLTDGTYATIECSENDVTLSWINDAGIREEVLRCSFGKNASNAYAYKLKIENPDKPLAGELVCRRVSIRDASVMDICRGREQIVIFMPDGVLIRRGLSKSFSLVKFRRD